eukprot:CAMPEP_0185777678 /NCGR_PEP_ID=MMETSP1174-20130828/90363_1 /TAXON_ID=35687 /ORGANISM="Dictyocha speculum, Strain CCMP1381" /LENGTH=39 /DNA_ID= /DNA_START= /DNA_END= /DNA_ORIENTATION=
MILTAEVLHQPRPPGLFLRVLDRKESRPKQETQVVAVGM